MSESNAKPSRYLFRAGVYGVEFGFDPHREEPPRRFVRLQAGFRAICRKLYRIPMSLHGLAVVLLFGVGLWGAYYWEKKLLLVLAAIFALVSIPLLRRWRERVWWLGVLFASLAVAVGVATQVVFWVPYLARGFAIQRVQQAGGEVQSYGVFRMEEVNRFTQALLGRDVLVGDVLSVRGPLIAFAPEIVRDLHLPPSVPIHVSDFPTDARDWSEHVLSVAEHSVMLNASGLNEATLRALSRKGLDIDLLVLEQEIRPADVELVSSSNVTFRTLRLYHIDSDSLRRLEGIVSAGKSVSNVYLSRCDWDESAARVLAQLGASLTLDTTYAEGPNQLPTAQLDALIAAKCRLEKLITATVDREQAVRLAQLTSLRTVTATLLDDASVDALKVLPLESIHVPRLNASVVASLMQYPNLGFIWADRMEAPVSVAGPILSNPNILSISVRTFRGSEAEIQAAKRTRMGLQEFEVVTSSEESVPIGPERPR